MLCHESSQMLPVKPMMKSRLLKPTKGDKLTVFVTRDAFEAPSLCSQQKEMYTYYCLVLYSVLGMTFSIVGTAEHLVKTHGI